MKKIISILCSIFISLILSTVVFAKDNQDDSFTKILNKGQMVIGLDETFAPMGFRDKNGQIVGFDVDLAKEVAKRLKIKAVFQPCVWDSIFMELKNRNIDAIWNGVTINSERKKNALFSKPYMTNRVIILVNENSPITKLADLTNKKIAAQAGSPAVDYIKDYKGKDFDPSALKEIIQYPDNPTALFDLAQSGVDAVVIDEIFADYYIKMRALKFKKLANFFAIEQDGVAFRKDDITLRNKVQEALDSMIKDGTAAQISQKWFGRNIFSQGGNNVK